MGVVLLKARLKPFLSGHHRCLMQPRRIAKLLVYELLRVTRWIFYVNWVYKPTGKTTLYVYIIYIWKGSDAEGPALDLWNLSWNVLNKVQWIGLRENLHRRNHPYSHSIWGVPGNLQPIHWKVEFVGLHQPPNPVQMLCSTCEKLQQIHYSNAAKTHGFECDEITHDRDQNNHVRLCFPIKGRDL